MNNNYYVDNGFVNEYIVRADFYPNGDIVPLGITDLSGKSVYVQNIIKATKISSNKYQIDCIANNRKITLIFKGLSWIVRYN